MSDDDNDPIGKALGVSPMVKYDPVQNMIAEAHDDSATTDFEKARANIHTMIENATEAMEKLSEIASQSQHPRAFEVLAKLMDTTLQANKDLLELQEKIRNIKAADAPINEKAQTINNNLFVGSTAELQKVIENLKNGGNNST
jgi:aminoglycoside phosphotransferase family enzyme